MMMTESAPGGAIDEVIGRAGYKASEFTPVYGWSVVSWQLCVKKDSPIRTFQQFVDECKKRRVVVGTIGRSGSSHIQLAALQKELNLPFGTGALRGLGQSLSGGDGRPCRRGDQRARLGLAHAREPALPRRHRRGAREGAARRADAHRAGLPVTPIDQIWYAMLTPKVPEDRIAILSNAFAKAFEDKLLWEQMQKAGEYLKLLTRPQVEDMVKKQAEVIERYKELLG